MAESIIEKCSERVNNRFKLALLASQRTHDLNTGASSAIELTKCKIHKNTSIALHEIAEGKIDTHELFSLLVIRCKEYMKGNTSNSYSSNTAKLKKLLSFSSDNNFSNISFCLAQKSANISPDNDEIKQEIDTRRQNNEKEGGQDIS